MVTSPPIAALRLTERNCFILSYLSVVEEREQITTYYGNWRDAENFGTLSDNGRIPYSGKVFLCKEDGKSYRWSGTQLASIGSDLALGHTSATAFPGDEGARLQEKMAQATQDITDNENALITQNKQIVARGIVNANKLFGLADKKVTFSVVLEKCATSEYAEVLQIPGIILTFFTESGWLSKQWTNTSDWNDESNWTDFGADSDIIGKDAVLLVDEIAPLSNGYYTLETAIAAIVSCQQETGVTYERTGLIITYKTGEYEMETRQFQGAVSDFNEVALWKNFGGEGSKVELGDAPEEGAIKPSQPVVRMIASLWTFLLTPRLKRCQNPNGQRQRRRCRRRETVSCRYRRWWRRWWHYCGHCF